MRKTPIKTCQFHCAGKRWHVSLRRGRAVCFAHKLEENKSFSWPSLVILVHIRTLIITRNLDTYHLATAAQPMFKPSSTRPQLCMSQQVWPFPSRVARSPPAASLAGFWGLRRDPLPCTAFVQTHAWGCKIWKLYFLQEHRRWRSCLFLFLLLYEHCANKTWFLGSLSVIALHTFRIKQIINQEVFLSYSYEFLSSSPDRPVHFHRYYQKVNHTCTAQYRAWGD